MDHMETTRLRLLRPTKQNLCDFHAIWSISEATRWSSRGCRKTIDESREQMKGLLVENNPDGENYAVFVRMDDSSPPTSDAIGI
ncbi:hypothetical protein ACLOAV_008490 [Pseudogymnoascus australis]